MAINNGISDLYFNHDKSEAENPPVHNRGQPAQFGGYDETLLGLNAGNFVLMLEIAGVQNIPTTDELIADFYSRR